MSLHVQRRARSLIANQLDAEGKHEEARLCRAGMRDNASTKVLAQTLVTCAAREQAAERQGQITGCMLGVCVGFIAAVILLA